MRVLITGASGWIGTALTQRARRRRPRGRRPGPLGRLRREDHRPRRHRRPRRHGRPRPDRRGGGAGRRGRPPRLHARLRRVRGDRRQRGRARSSGSARRYAGTGKAFVAASGTPILPRPGRHRGRPPRPGRAGRRAGPDGGRGAGAGATGACGRVSSGCRARVHGEGDRNGLIAMLVGLDRQLGTAAYVGDGANRWPAVHISDAGAPRSGSRSRRRPPAPCCTRWARRACRCATSPRSSRARTGLPAAAVDPEQLGVFGALLGGDQPASSTAHPQPGRLGADGPDPAATTSRPVTTPADGLSAAAGTSAGRPASCRRSGRSGSTAARSRRRTPRRPCRRRPGRPRRPCRAPASRTSSRP